MSGDQLNHTFRPLQVQHPALERCDNLGGRPEDEAEERSREELLGGARGASAGRPPLRI